MRVRMPLAESGKGGRRQRGLYGGGGSCAQLACAHVCAFAVASQLTTKKGDKQKKVTEHFLGRSRKLLLERGDADKLMPAGGAPKEQAVGADGVPTFKYNGKDTPYYSEVRKEGRHRCSAVACRRGCFGGGGAWRGASASAFASAGGGFSLPLCASLCLLSLSVSLSLSLSPG